MPVKYFPQLPEDPVSSDTKEDEETEDLFEPIPPAYSREEDDEEQHTSKGDSSETSGQALEHAGTKTPSETLQPLGARAKALGPKFPLLLNWQIR